MHFLRAYTAVVAGSGWEGTDPVLQARFGVHQLKFGFGFVRMSIPDDFFEIPCHVASSSCMYSSDEENSRYERPLKQRKPNDRERLSRNDRFLLLVDLLRILLHIFQTLARLVLIHHLLDGIHPVLAKWPDTIPTDPPHNFLN
jgi:hypothetical protein